MRAINGACMLLLLSMMAMGCGGGGTAIPAAMPNEHAENKASLDRTNAAAINKLELCKPDDAYPDRYPAVAGIMDAEVVQRVKTWMTNASWQNAEVSMSRPPDLKLVGTSTDPAVSGVRETFAIWVSPNKRNYEIVVEGRGLYGRMSERDSSRLRKWIESL
ncbi:hypothetical protein ACFFSY_20830 [Paenibacillus aurantiacus]|uniref:Lipoprotein n=1 Tax=Paenibacillus aurantiacus TaxID=1936118 RepID=A0ABV5KVZ4_9BACL